MLFKQITEVIQVSFSMSSQKSKSLVRYKLKGLIYLTKGYYTMLANFIRKLFISGMLLQVPATLGQTDNMSLTNIAGKLPSISPITMADAMHIIIQSNRTVYTQMVVNRLVNDEKKINVSEHYEDDVALPLPAQLFRRGAETITESYGAGDNLKFSYSLQSLWPVNKANGPRTEVEKAGLEYVAELNNGNYYTEEILNDQNYLTAIYADVAVADVCVSCHNMHKNSPKRNFKLGDVMGGIIIRIRLNDH
jgi:hypothetical protein